MVSLFDINIIIAIVFFPHISISHILLLNYQYTCKYQLTTNYFIDLVIFTTSLPPLPTFIVSIFEIVSSSITLPFNSILF